MEGILAPLPWTISRRCLYARCLPDVDRHYRDDAFHVFPEEHGLTWTHDAQCLVDACCNGRSLASLLQSWVFFGLLSTFLGRTIDRDDFITREYVDLNCASAHQHFQEWSLKLSAFSYHGKQLSYREHEGLLERASDISDIFDEAADCLNIEDEDYDLITLSIKLLINVLSAILEDTYSIICPTSSGPWAAWFSRLSDKAPRFPEINWTVNLLNQARDSQAVGLDLVQRGPNAAASKGIYSRSIRFCPFSLGTIQHGRAANRLFRSFTKNGWCPTGAFRLCQSQDFLVLNSLASLVRDPGNVEDHSKCVELHKCSSHDLALVQPSEYPYRHDCEDPGICDMIEAPRSKVKAIIESGGIPIISVAREGELDCQAVEWSPWLNYTAISHVWSDGLGNPRLNALPRCQLLRLRELISEADDLEKNPLYDGASIRTIMQLAFWRSLGQNHPYAKKDKKRINLWMDTLCIPVPTQVESHEYNTKIRLRAIKGISPVFAGAYNTLILDKGLQDANLADQRSVSGDEFAALIIASKWMQRGWTLEEGALSGLCDFRMMNNSYEMMSSLNHQLPVPGADCTPLSRVSMNSRLLLPKLLTHMMLGDKKQISLTVSSSKGSPAERSIRIPQFVRVWNSLLERSTTRSHDAPVIFANLMDFSALGMKGVKPEERLKVLIQSCDELPLSLLYRLNPLNSGPPELAWMPSNIEGQRLHTGAALRRVHSNVARRGPVRYYLDWSNVDSHNFHVLKSSRNVENSCIKEVFEISIDSGPSGVMMQTYLVKISRQPFNSIHVTDGQSPRYIYLVLDMTCGTRSRRGYSGKGILFYSRFADTKAATLRYGAPLEFWTRDQWQYSSPNLQHLDVPHLDTAIVDRRHRLFLTYDASLWETPRLRRRPILIKSGRAAKVTTFLILLIVLPLVIVAACYVVHEILVLLRLDKYPVPTFFIATPIVGSPTVVITSALVNWPFAVWDYIAWMKTFREEDGEDATNKSPKWSFRPWNIVSFVSREKTLKSMSLLLQWISGATSDQRSPHGVTQVSIRLPTRRQRNDLELQSRGDADDSDGTDELPGDIRLD